MPARRAARRCAARRRAAQHGGVFKSEACPIRNSSPWRLCSPHVCVPNLVKEREPPVKEKDRLPPRPSPRFRRKMSPAPRSPGVIAAGQKWKMAWQGEATADGMVGTDDGGLIFAQEQSNRLIKVDAKDNVTILRPGRTVPAHYRSGPTERSMRWATSCTDPDAVTRAACTEATDIAMLTPERKVLADKMAAGGAGLGRINDLTVAKNGWIYFTGTGALEMDPSGTLNPGSIRICAPTASRSAPMRNSYT